MCIDDRCEQAIRTGDASFHVSSRGHELSGVPGEFLTDDDWLHPHYRSKAMLLSRGFPVQTIFEMLLYADTTESRGRRLPVMWSSRELNIVSGVTPVGNSALQSIGIAQAIMEDGDSNAIVVCTMGDGALQQGEVLEALSTVAWQPLPVLFWVDDNRLALSTSTIGRTVLDRSSVFDIPACDVRADDVLGAREAVETAVRDVRQNRSARIVRAHVHRLGSHSNADDDSVYRNENHTLVDPVDVLRRQLIAEGVTSDELDRIEAKTRTDVCVAFDAARIHTSENVSLGVSRKPFDLRTISHSQSSAQNPARTIREAFQFSLAEWLEHDSRVVLLGEDIEDPKGDIFGVTKGLSSQFPGRVQNSPLTESWILGSSIGRAIAGQRPVAFFQFADFLPLAFNQLLNELSTLYWRTDGNWSAPVVLIVPAGGYRPGTGPFHTATYDSLLSQVPGVDLLFPSRPAMVAAALERAKASERPTVILYPKSLLNDPARYSDVPVATPGLPQRIQSGDDITIVTWGSCGPVVERVATEFRAHDVAADVFELHTLSPLVLKPVVESVRRTRTLLVVHEDYLSTGLGAEIVAQVSEGVDDLIRVGRVARTSFVPCHFEAHRAALPSFTSIADQVAELLRLDLEWMEATTASRDRIIFATGASPSDHQITVSVWNVAVGERVRTGDILAELEAEKAVFELASPCDGEVVELRVTAGDVVAVGTPVAVVRTEGEQASPSATIPNEIRPFAIHRRIRRSNMSTKPVATQGPQSKYAWLGKPASVLGSVRRRNSKMLEVAAKWSGDEIFKRVGVRERPIAADDEDVVRLATEATSTALDSSGLKIADFQSVICSTTTHLLCTPAVSSQVVRNLSPEGTHAPPAFDINAACSGYLYAAAIAFDQLAGNPSQPILLITSEVISPYIDENDPNTTYIFGDAATATVIYPTAQQQTLACERPILSSVPDTPESLYAHHNGQRLVLSMDGVPVSRAAKRGMTKLGKTVCDRAGVAPEELEYVIAHQANQRILDGVAWNLSQPKDKFITTLADTGNTSSSSIPICLERNWETLTASSKPSLLVAFGAGYTVGASLIRATGQPN